MKAFSKTKTVYELLYQRLIKIFKNGLPVFFSFSGGKESLVIAQALLELIQQKKIDPKMLHVLFIDEEAIYPCVERIVRSWRKRYIMAGAHFHWLCLEFIHFSCFNELSQDESMVLWDSTKRDVWIRQKPDFAISSHPLFKAGYNYQTFMNKINNVVQIVGVRAGESIQRLKNISVNGGITLKNSYYLYPIYDWSLNDVWLYLHEKKVELPDAYYYMWKVGVPANRLRISQFFSIDTAPSLVKMMEFYPGLYEKILKREPNAYLAMYYYDTQMFRRNTKTRKKLEGEQEKDWKKEFYEIYNDPRYKDKKEREDIKKILVKNGLIVPDKLYRDLKDIIVGGDPKNRTKRAIYSRIGTEYYKQTREGKK